MIKLRDFLQKEVVKVNICAKLGLYIYRTGGLENDN